MSDNSVFIFVWTIPLNYFKSRPYEKNTLGWNYFVIKISLLIK